MTNISLTPVHEYYIDELRPRGRSPTRRTGARRAYMPPSFDVRGFVLDIPHAQFDQALDEPTEPGSIIYGSILIACSDQDHHVSIQWADSDPLGDYSLATMVIYGPAKPQRPLVASVTFLADGAPLPGVLLRFVLAKAAQLRNAILLFEDPGQDPEARERFFSLKWWGEEEKEHILQARVVGNSVTVALSTINEASEPA